MKHVERLFKFLASLKLAVLIIVSLGIASAWGTIVESRYDMITAQKLVYHSWYMYSILGFLIVNLVAVMVDRLPWKKKHLGFILAHIGIITLLVGSYITRVVGIDGTLVFDVGESQRYVSLIAHNEIVVYQMKDFEESNKIYQEQVEFLVNDPKDHPVKVPIENGFIEFVDYMPYAQKSFEIIESDKMMDGPALRFQLNNQFVNLTEWIVQMGTQPAKLSLGPAQVVLARDESYQSLGGLNEIILWPSRQTQKLNYKILTKEGEVQKQGTMGFADEIDTGWMGMKFRTLQFYPKSKVQYEYKALERPNANSVSAAKFIFEGREHWIGLNTALELYSKDSVYFITYGNKRIDLGFPLTLDKFEMEKYQGTEMAASYKSIVTVPGVGVQEISMNEPLKHKGFTFYQSSYQQDKTGQPIGSVLSVNKDPGRFWKYLGSLLIVLGSIILFYFRHTQKKESSSNAQ